MSSTEAVAEIIAASACALELVFIRRLLHELGLEQTSPTELLVDNSGAVELSVIASRAIARGTLIVAISKCVSSLLLEKSRWCT